MNYVWQTRGLGWATKHAKQTNKQIKLRIYIETSESWGAFCVAYYKYFMYLHKKTLLK